MSTGSQQIEYRLEAARAQDAAEIKSMVRGESLNPLGLDWRRFTVVRKWADGEILGCVQIKPHGDGSQELASLVVKESWRGRGIGSHLVRHCQKQHNRRLYLTCRGRLGSYYRQFGFKAVPLAGMPPYFKRLARLVQVFEVFLAEGEGLLVMCWQPETA